MGDGLAPSNTAEKVIFTLGRPTFPPTSLYSWLVCLYLPGALFHPIRLYFNVSQCQSFLPNEFAFNLYLQALNANIIINL